MAKQTEDEIVWITVLAAAEIVDVTPGRIRQIIDNGQLNWKPDENYRRFLLVDQADVHRYAASPRQPGRPPAKA